MPYHHSVSNSDSGFVTSRNSEDGPVSQQTKQTVHNDTKKILSQDNMEMSLMSQSFSDVGSGVFVEYETRDGTAKQGTHYEYQCGSLVS